MSKPYSYAKVAWNKFQANRTSTHGGAQVKTSTSRKTRGKPSQGRNPRKGPQTFFNEQSRRKTT